jgi:pyruvate kinase
MSALSTFGQITVDEGTVRLETGGRSDYNFFRVRASAFVSGTVNVNLYCGINSFSIQVTGTFSATLEFEASNNGADWVATSFIPSTTATAVEGATAVGLWSR